jgi:hypothetical protein
MIQNNSLWSSAAGSRFLVLNTYTDGEDIKWVHYRQFDCDECREFSCYQEAFLSRFTEVPNER